MFLLNQILNIAENNILITHTRQLKEIYRKSIVLIHIPRPVMIQFEIVISLFGDFELGFETWMTLQNG